MISYRVAIIVRPDRSYGQLLDWRAQGYEEVVFVANLAADPQCKQFDGNPYKIADLLRYDNPLYRTSHPNCNCQFVPYGQPAGAAPTTVGTNEEPEEGQGSDQTNQAGNI